MRILILHNKYKNLGGEDIAVENEYNFLSNFYEVETLYYENNLKNYIFDFFSLITGKNFKSIKYLDQKVKSFQPDIVYVHNTWFKASTGVFNYLRKNNINTVLKIHNFRYFCTRSFRSSTHFSIGDMCPACGLFKKNMGYFNKYFKESFVKSIYVCLYGKRYLNIIKNFPIKMIVLTNFHKNFLVNMGVNESKLTVIPNYLEVNNKDKSFKKSQKKLFMLAVFQLRKELKN